MFLLFYFKTAMYVLSLVLKSLLIVSFAILESSKSSLLLRINQRYRITFNLLILKLLSSFFSNNVKSVSLNYFSRSRTLLHGISTLLSTSKTFKNVESSILVKSSLLSSIMLSSSRNSETNLSVDTWSQKNWKSRLQCWKTESQNNTKLRTIRKKYAKLVQPLIKNLQWKVCSSRNSLKLAIKIGKSTNDNSFTTSKLSINDFIRNVSIVTKTIVFNIKTFVFRWVDLWDIVVAMILQ